MATRRLTTHWFAGLTGLEGFGPTLARLWYRRARTRKQLAALDARRLADLGVTETERARECAKPFWQA